MAACAIANASAISLVISIGEPISQRTKTALAALATLPTAARSKPTVFGTVVASVPSTKSGSASLSMLLYSVEKPSFN